jgi:hypothetical protein
MTSVAGKVPLAPQQRRWVRLIVVGVLTALAIASNRSVGRIWVRTYRGERIQIWQGNGEANFRANLVILQKETGLPLG